MSYAQPSPPKIHWDLLTKNSLSFKIVLAISASQFSSAVTKAFALSLVPTLSSLFSNQSFNTALVSSAILLSNATFTLSAILSLIALTPKNIPKPYSALSSNNEFAQAGPCPLWLTVYGVAGADPPQIEEHPVALATIILSPNNWVTSLAYGVSPQPAQAPENSRSGCSNWLPFNVFLFIGFFLADTSVVA